MEGSSCLGFMFAGFWMMYLGAQPHDIRTEDRRETLMLMKQA